jgi:DNA-directed RNA polymerase subunit RPC12/RpoP
MPRRSDRGRSWDEPDFDDEADDGDLPDEDEDEPTVPCPYCRREIHEEAVRCPYCEHYISDEDAPPRRRPWWLVIGVVVCLYAVYRWIRSS